MLSARNMNNTCDVIANFYSFGFYEGLNSICACLFCRLMKAQTLGDTSTLEFMRGRRILEVNPDHPIIKDLNVRFSLSLSLSLSLCAIIY